jgi:hypothetical protein
MTRRQEHGCFCRAGHGRHYFAGIPCEKNDNFGSQSGEALNVKDERTTHPYRTILTAFSCSHFLQWHLNLSSSGIAR